MWVAKIVAYSGTCRHSYLSSWDFPSWGKAPSQLGSRIFWNCKVYYCDSLSTSKRSTYSYWSKVLQILHSGWQACVYLLRSG